MLENILSQYGLNSSGYEIQPFGSGLINHTFKITGKGDAYILQQVNTNVFKQPGQIVQNLTLLQEYFWQTEPGYLFVGLLPTTSGNFLARSIIGEVFRLFPFVKGSHTVNFISGEKEAFEAARQFGRFTRLLKDFDISQLKYTLPDFHNLKLRFEQFKSAYENASKMRLDEAFEEIKEVYDYFYIRQTYNQLAENEVPLRVIHHDTKISNVLFDEQQNGLCVIDLDTVMPGYYLSDVGDMLRTYLSPANEEESNLFKVYVRENIFSAIYKGYMSEMGGVLSEQEKNYFIFSGKLMIYMQALRFLTDFLNNDIYYETKYPGHNLTRARNQFKLLKEYTDAEDRLRQLIINSEGEISTAFDN